jgi:hypothetical protein
MKEETIAELKRKGWSAAEIQKAEQTIRERKMMDKSRTSVFSNKIVYWMVIAVIVLGNFIVSILLIPFLLVLNRLALNLVIILLGFAIGLLFNFLINDVEHIGKKHHLLAGFLIPILALVNISVMINVANAINSALSIGALKEDPVTLSIMYVAAFILPYLWTVFVSRKINIAY